MNDNYYNILCATDDKFVPYCGIMLTSLFENNKNIKFNVYIITEGLNRTNIEDFEKLGKKYLQAISILTIDPQNLKDFPIKKSDHVSIVTYYRLFATSLLPQNIEKVLYLDGDIIINDSIQDLYNTNIDNYAIGAIIDEDYKNEEKYNRLQIPKENYYINAGVLLMNLKYWKEHNIIDKCLTFIEKKKEQILQHDQDIINAVLKQNIKRLPIKYNLQTGFLFRERYFFDENVKKEVQRCLQQPTIIHYTTIRKPWIKRCQHPYRNHFHYYRKKSLWKELEMLDADNTKAKLIYYIARIVWTIGLKKRPKPFIINLQQPIS